MMDSFYFDLALDLACKARAYGNNCGVMSLFDMMPMDHEEINYTLDADPEYASFSEELDVVEEEDVPL